MRDLTGKLKHYFAYLVCVFKLVVAWFCVLFRRKQLYAMDLWIIQEKHTEARDNGYHLFKYIRTVHPEINAYYSITKDSADLGKVRQLGNVVIADSFRHYVYYLAAKNSIGSQKFGACPYPTDWVNRFRFLCRRDQKVIFLQHGILGNAAPGLAFEKTRFDLFVVSAQREYDFVRHELRYPVGRVQLLGLCRFDNLLNANSTHRQILIMPTFRSYLSAKARERDATEGECARFMQSDFYKNYYELLSDERLLNVLHEQKYKIIFYMHYSLQAYTKCFAELEGEDVLIADRAGYDVQTLLMESDVLVTDYSSIFFDFAYMKKPEAFFQFDQETFRKKHYDVGYFDHSKDGFGPVFTDRSDLVDFLIGQVRMGCVMEKEYERKVDAFFYFHDQQNCMRNFSAIEGLNQDEQRKESIT